MVRRGEHILDGQRARRMLQPAISALRSIVGHDSGFEQRVKRTLRIDVENTRGSRFVEWRGSRGFAVQSTAGADPRRGIYLRGACDLPTLFSLAPLLRVEPRGTIALAHAAHQIDATRADLLLQTLEGLPTSVTKEVCRRAKLSHDYFEPSLFEPNFIVPGFRNLGLFPKTVVVLSLAPNVTRSVYRHREHGILVDPGGAWLNRDLNTALRDGASIAWFRETFEPIGRLSVEDFVEHFSSVIRLLRERARVEHILVFNVLTVEPGDRVHNYQLRRHPEVLRRREFCLALVDLSRALDFHIVDVDRILKRHGVDRLLDFAHFPTDMHEPIAADVFRILHALDVV
jgi:hypothetical protein